jgi:hypothetical protein
MITLRQLEYICLRSYGESSVLNQGLSDRNRVTLRLLQSELVQNDTIDHDILDQISTVFDGALNQAKSSQRRPSTPEQQLFTVVELEWFCKNSYNFSLKHCAEIPPQNTVRFLNVCAEVSDVCIVCRTGH